MKNRNNQILAVMHVLCWVAFIGLLIKGGAILVAYGVSLFNPQASQDLYQGLNLLALRQYSFWHYSGSVSFIVAMVLLQAFIAFLVIKVLGKIKLEHPFKMEVSLLLERIGNITLATWVVAVLSNAHTKWLWKRVDGFEGELVSVEFIFLAGVVFILSQVFKKGVDLQTEQELTV
ncbi:DUF2975 domain-containing protein [Paracnuella aquatica]|uniref:DUF2975 domain-containing protein n=1 Tax=Paracnuella aquatica TaxID=2268757 RepID=UPI00138FAC56|nr:DUF2975 domain-containing protein [Paracnuella aquatica]